MVSLLPNLPGVQVPKPPPPLKDAWSADDRETVELIVMGMNAAGVSEACKDKLGVTLRNVIDMRIARLNAKATRGGDEVMA